MKYYKQCAPALRKGDPWKNVSRLLAKFNLCYIQLYIKWAGVRKPEAFRRAALFCTIHRRTRNLTFDCIILPWILSRRWEREREREKEKRTSRADLLNDCYLLNETRCDTRLGSPSTLKWTFFLYSIYRPICLDPL